MTSDKRHPAPHKVTDGKPNNSPQLEVSWYGGFDWTDGHVYYGEFIADSVIPRYSDMSSEGLQFLRGPVEPEDEHYHDYYGGSGWDDPEWCYGSYGDPKDTTAFPPPVDTDYHRYGDMECFVYGIKTDERPSPFPIVPEDARSIICEVNPTRVNHILDPNFKAPLNRGEKAWHTKGKVVKVSQTESPYSSSGLLMWPGALAEYGGFGNYDNAIYVGNMSPVGQGGQDISSKDSAVNLWKIAFATNVRTRVFAGLKVMHSNGQFSTHLGQTVPVARPWESTHMPPPDELQVTIAIDPDLAVALGTQQSTVPEQYKPTRIAGAENITPESTSGWYIYYDVIDVGANALWALPFVGTMSNKAAGSIGLPAMVSSVIVERWDEDWLLTGDMIPEPLQVSPSPGENSITYLKSDPLIFFDGDSEGPSSDFVWMGQPHKSATGYYPQRETRVEGLRKLMNSWLPLGRSLSIRYVYERP